MGFKNGETHVGNGSAKLYVHSRPLVWAIRRFLSGFLIFLWIFVRPSTPYKSCFLASNSFGTLLDRFLVSRSSFSLRKTYFQALGHRFSLIFRHFWNFCFMLNLWTLITTFESSPRGLGALPLARSHSELIFRPSFVLVDAQGPELWAVKGFISVFVNVRSSISWRPRANFFGAYVWVL